MTKEKFSLTIEKIVRDDKLSYIDAITWWCEENEMEVETAAKLLSPLIKEKMFVQCQDLNLLTIKRGEGSKLPI